MGSGDIDILELMQTGIISCTYLAREPNNLPLLQNEQGALQRVTRKALLRDELAYKTLIAGAPSDRKSSPELLLNAVHLIVDLTAREPIRRAGRHRIHRRELEQPDRLLDVMVLYDWRECKLGLRFRYPDNSFKLPV